MLTPEILAALEAFQRDMVDLLTQALSEEARAAEPSSSVVEIQRFETSWPPPDTAAGRVLAMLRASAQPVTPREIRESLGLAPSAVSHALARLLAHGVAEAIGPSKYKRRFVATHLAAIRRAPQRRAPSIGVALPVEGNAIASLETVERQYILHVLERLHGNKSKTARVLKVDRRTLYRKLEAWQRDASIGTTIARPDRESTG